MVIYRYEGEIRGFGTLVWNSIPVLFPKSLDHGRTRQSWAAVRTASAYQLPQAWQLIT